VHGSGSFRPSSPAPHELEAGTEMMSTKLCHLPIHPSKLLWRKSAKRLCGDLLQNRSNFLNREPVVSIFAALCHCSRLSTARYFPRSVLLRR
jgi:hypothetical protein